MYDVIIVGAGPAGLSAALYTSRANIRTLVIGKDGGALERVEKIENYFGVPAPISGRELLGHSRNQAQGFGADVLEDEVLGISWDGTFHVTGKQGEYEAVAVILATGASRVKAKIAGLSEHEGRGVSYCAVCDAFFYRGRAVAVLGHGDYALHELSHLLPVAGAAVLCTNGEELEGHAPEGVQVETAEIAAVTGDEFVEAVEFLDGRQIPVSGVFVALGSAGAVELARKLGAQTEGNKIRTDDKMATNIPGLYAAGDCTGGLLQIATAVGEGAQAAMGAISFARKNRKEK